ncbi:cupin domain-containing protein [Solimicrobium silvestre]|uniref:Transcriptional activator n=1 Tax=Solimicrobium silvestre TaxID=2099400 RepID=A0A2S9H0B7_9BURK|nr:cupin domain-containing protein [Solimicrobium silvestre]PRC93421.1 Transcriptional activator [Solimicrobium silvestre]
MKLNADQSKRVVLYSEQLPWVASPVPGIERRLLARDGAEQAKATSIVRYEAGAVFTPHAHPQGEEVVVLEGMFEDEHGSYPTGTYIKNPPGSVHTPKSTDGCVLFVKLRHLDDDDLERVVVRPANQQWHPGMVKGLKVAALDQFGTSHTALVRWAPGTYFSKHQHYGGEEILVLEGTFQDEYGSYPTGTWIRSPHLSAHQPYSESGCLILVKVGHLMDS